MAKIPNKLTTHTKTCIKLGQKLILLSSVISGQSHQTGIEKLSHQNILAMQGTTENMNATRDDENINRFEKSASRTELRPCGDANLHVFHCDVE